MAEKNQYLKDLKKICPESYQPQILQACEDALYDLEIPYMYSQIVELLGKPEEFVNNYIEENLEFSIQGSSRTKLYKISLGINFISFIGSLILFGLTLIISIKQIYKYVILDTPYDPFDPPLIILGVVVTIIYFIAALISGATSFLTLKRHRLAKEFNLILIPFYFLVFNIIPFFGIFVVIIQLYIYIFHQPTVRLFSEQIIINSTNIT